MNKHAGLIIFIILILIGSCIAVYFYLTRTRTPKVVNGAQAIFTVDKLGNVYDAQGLLVGKDNGDDSWTATNGAIMDYNNNVLTPAPGTPATQTNTNTVSGSNGTAAASKTATGDSTAASNSSWYDGFVEFFY